MDPYNQAMCRLFDTIKIRILDNLKQTGYSPEALKKAAQVFDTEYGKSVLSKLIGDGIIHSPFGQDPRAQKLADMFLNGASK